MAYASRVKNAFEQIFDELEAITTGNGYYTSPAVKRIIRPAEDVVETEIGLEMGEETMDPMDDNAISFDSEVMVYVCGTTSANSAVDYDASELVDATEKLRHDIKRVIAGMFYKYAPNTSGNLRWNVKRGTISVFPVMGLGEKRNKAQVWARFKIAIRNQHASTLTSGHGEEPFGEGAGYAGF